MKYYNKVMVFDVETTGLIQKEKMHNIESYPFILQMSWAIYDIHNFNIIKMFNKYINIDQQIEIPSFITELTGCTRELCDNGIQLRDILIEFYKDFHECYIVSAHNISFDSAILKAEITRNWQYIKDICPNFDKIFNKDYCNLIDVELLCTMRSTTNVCKIKKEKISGYKFPKLKELYVTCFNKSIPNQLHNSMVDVIVCLRCLLKIKFGIEISEVEINNYIALGIELNHVNC